MKNEFVFREIIIDVDGWEILHDFPDACEQRLMRLCQGSSIYFCLTNTSAISISLEARSAWSLDNIAVRCWRLSGEGIISGILMGGI
jgi:hypothetical protein